MATLLDGVDWTGKIFSGRWTSSAGGTVEDVEPATGKVLGEVGVATPADVSSSCAAAAVAQKNWDRLVHAERAKVLLEAAGLLREHHEECAGWIMRECGGTRAKAEAELADAQQRLLRAAAMTGEPFGQVVPSGFPGRWSVAQRVPLGVVGVISPFNFPLILSMRSVAPALAAGNSVVLKPDARTPVSGGFLIARALEEAGLPEGVLHVLPGPGAETGAALVEDPHVAMISFTGSTPVGRTIGEACGRLLKKAVLELGGNNPFVVLDDADVAVAASAGTWGSFFHQGQICMATGRHIVHRSIAPAYVEALTETAARLRVGDPMAGDPDLGPIIDQGQLRHIDALVRRSMQQGARATTGADYQDLFYRPTVMADVGPGTPVYDEEIFGPVAAVTTFSDDEEAIQLANDSEFGLKAAVHSGSFDHAVDVGRRLVAGAVHINDSTVNDEAVAPFPAVKASGNLGAFGGPANVEEFTRWQWTTARDRQVPMPLGAS